MSAAAANARRLGRLAALAAWTAALLAVLFAALVPARLAGRVPAWRARVQRRWSRGVCRILGVRLRVDGAPPPGPCLLVANHLSYLDVVVLGALVPCAFVAKSEIARWPVVGALARWAGTLFVERERKRSLAPLNRELSRRLARGESVVIFPEGTSTAGRDVLAFRPALLAPAAELGLPVRTAALRYATPPGAPAAPDAVCWWGDAEFTGHFLRLLRIPWIEARVAFGTEPIAAPDRKLLAARLQRAVAERFVPLTEHA